MNLREPITLVLDMQIAESSFVFFSYTLYPVREGERWEKQSHSPHRELPHSFAQDACVES